MNKVKIVPNGSKVEGAITSLINGTNLQLKCGKVSHETLLVPVSLYGSEIAVKREKEKSRIRVVQMDILRGFFRIDKTLNARIPELCEVTRRRGRGSLA